MSRCRNSLFRNFEKLRPRKIGFSMKFQLGYPENQFFTTLGGGVKHGIQISFENTKFRIPTFVLMNYDITHFSKNVWVPKLTFSSFWKIRTSKNRILLQISARLARDSLFFDPWWRGKTWDKDFI